MKDISYHILDIVGNSLQAGATQIAISISDKESAGTLKLLITDNGCGMDAKILQQVTNPFYTTSNNKNVGLGLPLLKQNAELTGGYLRIESVKNQGTQIEALFNKHHIDMLPQGDVALTLRILIAANRSVDIIYSHHSDQGSFEVNTADIRRELGESHFASTEVLDYITGFIRENLKAIHYETHE
jgi:hypothetical protein